MVKIAIIGCGTLGIKIVGSLAYYGHNVRIYDINTSLLNTIEIKLNDDRKFLHENGFLVENNFTGDVYCFSVLKEAVKGCQFVIESINENLEQKKDVLKAIEENCPKDTVITSSTMRLSIDKVFEDMIYKERCLGMRFLYPVYFIPEVEIVAGKFTSGYTLEKVRQFLEQMGQIAFLRSGSEPVVLNDTQRESRRNAYIRQLNDQRISKFSLSMPDLRSSSSNQLKLSHLCSDLENNCVKKEKECVVCMDIERDCVFNPCHHLCTCTNCGKLLLDRHDLCPICRRVITSVFRVYHP